MANESNDLSVVHDLRNSRFCIKLEGSEACLEYRLSGGKIDFYHTYVPESARGRGIAEKLCHAGFEHAKAQGLTVTPSCPYVSGTYLKRHTEYGPITNPGNSSAGSPVSS